MAWNKKRTEQSCLPTGEYDGEIYSVEQAVSKKGNPMVVIVVTISYGDRQASVKDWLVQGNSYWKPKVAAIAAALGKSDELAAGTFRLSEQVRLPIRVYVTRENDPSYGWQNRLSKYMSTGLGMGPDVPPPAAVKGYETYPDPMEPGLPF